MMVKETLVMLVDQLRDLIVTISPLPDMVSFGIFAAVLGFILNKTILNENTMLIVLSALIFLLLGFL